LSAELRGCSGLVFDLEKGVRGAQREKASRKNKGTDDFITEARGEEVNDQ